MASFFDRFNSKQLTIVIVCITACFLMMGACTMVLGNEDTDTQKEKNSSSTMMTTAPTKGDANISSWIRKTVRRVSRATVW